MQIFHSPTTVVLAIKYVWKLVIPHFTLLVVNSIFLVLCYSLYIYPILPIILTLSPCKSFIQIYWTLKSKLIIVLHFSEIGLSHKNENQQSLHLHFSVYLLCCIRPYQFWIEKLSLFIDSAGLKCLLSFNIILNTWHLRTSF